MEQSYLIEVVKRDCPFCNKVHEIEKRKREGSMLIRNEPVHFEEVYFFCPYCANDEENEFVPAWLMDQNLQNARNAYRKVHGLLTSDEIAEIRNMYGMSQSDLALLLGWGEVTITRYENKLIQDETYDQFLRLVKSDPLFALERLKTQKAKFSDDKFNQLKLSIQKHLDEDAFFNLKRKEIENRYFSYDEPCDFNGFQVLNLNKLGNVMAFFAQYFDNLFKVKLMKLLWYVDALCFKQYGKAVTGLVYEHMPYGALPLANTEIIYLPNLSVEEKEIEDTIGYHVTPRGGASLDSLTSDEIDIVYLVAKKFKNMSTPQIVEYMHNEDAYKKTTMHQIIPFSLCKTLRDIRCN